MFKVEARLPSLTRAAAQGGREGVRVGMEQRGEARFRALNTGRYLSMCLRLDESGGGSTREYSFYYSLSLSLIYIYIYIYMYIYIYVYIYIYI